MLSTEEKFGPLQKPSISKNIVTTKPLYSTLKEQDISTKKKIINTVEKKEPLFVNTLQKNFMMFIKKKKEKETPPTNSWFAKKCVKMITQTRKNILYQVYLVLNTCVISLKYTIFNIFLVN